MGKRSTPNLPHTSGMQAALSEVAAAYQKTRAWARWRTTFRLRRYESRASGRAQPGVSDQISDARLKAVRDELAARGKRAAPEHRGLP
jgi:hypothetical protein